MFLTDALGSVITTISAAPNSAAVQGTQVYGPYGTARYQQGQMDTTKGFTGQYTDSLSGLDYYNARYYDPVVGRFLSADPVEGNGAGLDPYAYVGNNPETDTDPSGLRVISPAGQLGPRNAIVSPTAYPDVKRAATIPMDKPPAQGGCPYGSSASCTKQRVATEVPGTTVVSTKLRLSTQVSGLACTATTEDACVMTPLTGHIMTDGQGLFRTSAVAEYSTCLTSPLACASEDSGEGAKGEAESYDLGIEGSCSFTPTTLVTTDHGKQAIGTLQVGEKVVAYNPKTGKMEQEPVLHVWISHDHDLVDLTITTTMKGQQSKTAAKTSEVIHTNQQHPFFTWERGFLPVGQIKLGMHILRADGRVGVVTGWEVVPGTKTMYNLEVAHDHTFTVGTGQWVVHNECDFAFLAHELADSLHKAAFQDTHSTTAVAFARDEDGNVITLAGINSSSLRPWRVRALEGLLGEDGIIVPSARPDLHAEQNILAYMRANNLELLGIGASREICLERCAPAILDFSGGNFGVIGSPIKDYLNKIIVWRPEW